MSADRYIGKEKYQHHNSKCAFLYNLKDLENRKKFVIAMLYYNFALPFLLLFDRSIFHYI